MPSGFQQQWLALMLLAASALAIWQGMRAAIRREIANPLLEVRGARALAIGVALAAVGVAGAAMAILEGLRARP